MEHATAFYEDPTFWVAIAFLVFMGGVLYAKVHLQLAASLDDKAASIKAQLDEALNLRKDAEKFLADYQRKQRESQKLAETIISDAEVAAESLKAQAKKDIAELIERRERLSKEKLAQAELFAVKEVKNAAVTAAVAAAKELLAEGLKGKSGEALVKSSIDEVGSKLH